ncbi:MAG: conjugal transfer protein TraR [Ignavibacteria bacterium]|nr:conjugal transfer protein TraR [Ignavibacteria bacterium]
MAKKTTKKKVTKKNAAGKAGLKKKTGVKKITKKKTTKTTAPKKKSTVKKKTAAKKAVGRKVTKKKTTKTSKPKKKTTAKKTVGRKVTKKKTTKTSKPKKKTTAKKAVAKKIVATKKITSTNTRKKVTKPLKKTTAVRSRANKEKTMEDVISTAEARAKAIKKIKGYGKKDFEHFKSIIMEKRDEIIEQLQNLKEQMLDPTTGEYINENSPYSLHMAEQGTDAMEREKTFLYAQRENKFLGYLEDALKRIDSGTYGICVECIEEPQNLCGTCPLIPKERLQAVPHSQHCLPIKQRQEKM